MLVEHVLSQKIFKSLELELELLLHGLELHLMVQVILLQECRQQDMITLVLKHAINVITWQ